VELGYKDSIVEIDNGTFEGDDAALLGNTCFVGVGARTSSSAVRNLAKKIGPLMEEHGIQVAAVVNERHEDEADDYGAPMDEHMSLIHLDMFWIPLEPKLVLANSDELDQRKIVRVSRNAGTFVIEEMGSFRQFHANKGIEIIDVNKQA
jgi:arginine deiminase